jgi:hypothetical protein
MLVTAATMRMATLEELIDTGNILDAALVGLFKANHEPSADDTFAFYTAVGTEANFTGYIRGTAIVWSDVFQDSSKNAYCTGGLLEFAAIAPTPPAAFEPNIVYGYFVYKGTALLYAEKFKDAAGVDTPVNVANEFSMCPVIPRFSYGQ